MLTSKVNCDYKDNYERLVFWLNVSLTCSMKSSHRNKVDLSKKTKRIWKQNYIDW